MSKILELREKMAESVSLSDEPLENASANIDDKDYQDAMLALLGLGFEKGECIKVLTKAKTENVMGVQAVIAYSLKNIR